MNPQYSQYSAQSGAGAGGGAGAAGEGTNAVRYPPAGLPSNPYHNNQQLNQHPLPPIPDFGRAYDGRSGGGGGGGGSGGGDGSMSARGGRGGGGGAATGRDGGSGRGDRDGGRRGSGGGGGSAAGARRGGGGMRGSGGRDEGGYNGNSGRPGPYDEYSGGPSGGSPPRRSGGPRGSRRSASPDYNRGANYGASEGAGRDNNWGGADYSQRGTSYGDDSSSGRRQGGSAFYDDEHLDQSREGGDRGGRGRGGGRNGRRDRIGRRDRGVRDANGRADFENDRGHDSREDKTTFNDEVRRGERIDENQMIEDRLNRERPCRTLFLRNIKYETPSEEVRTLFERMGEIKSFFDLISTRGMVFVTYYDLRAATLAKEKLQGTALSNRPIDVHYSLPREIDLAKRCDRDKNQGTILVTVPDSRFPINEQELAARFGACGDIKLIFPSRDHPSDRYVEFFDSRGAEKAFDTLDDLPLAGGRMLLKFVWDIAPPIHPNANYDSPSGTYGAQLPRGAPPAANSPLRFGAASTPSYAAPPVSSMNDRLEQAQKVQQLLSALTNPGAPTVPTPLPGDSRATGYGMPSYSNSSSGGSSGFPSSGPAAQNGGQYGYETSQRHSAAPPPNASLPPALLALLAQQNAGSNAALPNSQQTAPVGYLQQPSLQNYAPSYPPYAAPGQHNGPSPQYGQSAPAQQYSTASTGSLPSQDPQLATNTPSQVQALLALLAQQQKRS